MLDRDNELTAIVSGIHFDYVSLRGASVQKGRGVLDKAGDLTTRIVHIQNWS